MKRQHYRGTYQVQAKRIRDRANANPATQCWRCGRTKQQHQRPWHAGHAHDGQINGLLLAECEQCNTRAGGRLAAQRNKLRRLNTSRNW